MSKRKAIGEAKLDFLDNKNSKSWLQNEFLAIIRKLEPKYKKQPLGDLTKLALDEYVRFIDGRDRKSISRRQKVSNKWKPKKSLDELTAQDRPNLPDELSYFSLLDADDPLRKAIQQWGETYHLNSAWCYDVALRTLQNWHDFKETAGKWFAFVPSFAHANFIGFASLVDIYKLISLPPDSLTELQKEFLASSRFSEQDRQFVESFTEQERAFLSMYTHDPHIMSDEHFLNQMEELIKAGIPSVNTYLPVLNLLSRADRESLQNKLWQRAGELLEKVKTVAQRFGSGKPMQRGAEEILKHLEWAVRCQVFEESYYSIEGRRYEYQDERHRASVKVRKAVNSILEIVDLSPRPTKRGRKRHL